MSGVHALRALEGPALRSVGEGMAHASARGRDGAREIAWVYGGSEPPQPGDGAFLVDVPFFDGDGLEDIDDIEDVVVALFASVEDMENEDDDMARANALALRAKERAVVEAKVAREGMRLEATRSRGRSASKESCSIGTTVEACASLVETMLAHTSIDPKSSLLRGCFLSTFFKTGSSSMLTPRRRLLATARCAWRRSAMRSPRGRCTRFSLHLDGRNGIRPKPTVRGNGMAPT